MIKLNDLVVDKITGFTGIVNARTDWLYGCVRFGVKSRELKDGKPIEAEWFDEEQLELAAADPTQQGTIPPIGETVKKGGPQKDPRRTDDPSRM